MYTYLLGPAEGEEPDDARAYTVIVIIVIILIIMLIVIIMITILIRLIIQTIILLAKYCGFVLQG